MGGLSVSVCLPVLTALRMPFLSPQQEVQNIFKAKHPMDTEITKAKVKGCGGVPKADTVASALPDPLLLLDRSLDLVPHSSRKSIPILRILWVLASSIPEPPRSGACCVWSLICKPRSGLLWRWVGPQTSRCGGTRAGRCAGPGWGARAARAHHAHGVPLPVPLSTGLVCGAHAGSMLHCHQWCFLSALSSVLLASGPQSVSSSAGGTSCHFMGDPWRAAAPREVPG